MKHIITAVVIALSAAALAQPGRSDSLWPAERQGSLYADQRAHAVGDLLTVIIVQSSVASHEAESETNKSASASASPGAGLLSFFPDFGLGAKRSTSGSGSTVSKTQFADRMTARVTEVLPNGALRIEGVRSTVINAEKMELRLTGVVRPQDVSPDNTVLSSNLADEQIEWTGKGPIAEKQRPGLISRLLHFLF
jgi:flagellar L-ring protein precursor FlgH